MPVGDVVEQAQDKAWRLRRRGREYSSTVVSAPAAGYRAPERSLWPSSTSRDSWPTSRATPSTTGSTCTTSAHFVETYSLRQLWEVDVHPEEACSGPIDLHLSLEVDPRALLGFEDEVVKTRRPRRAEPPRRLPVPPAVHLDVAAAPRARPTCSCWPPSWPASAVVDLPVEVSAIDSFASGHRRACERSAVARRPHPGVASPTCTSATRKRFADVLDRCKDVSLFLLDRAKDWLGDCDAAIDCHRPDPPQIEGDLLMRVRELIDILRDQRSREPRSSWRSSPRCDEDSPTTSPSTATRSRACCRGSRTTTPRRTMASPCGWSAARRKTSRRSSTRSSRTPQLTEQPARLTDGPRGLRGWARATALAIVAMPGDRTRHLRGVRLPPRARRAALSR